jgi:hypothetical protein
MFLRPTKQLSEKATKEVLNELASPKSTPEMKAQQEQVKAMAVKIQKKAKAKSRRISASR